MKPRNWIALLILLLVVAGAWRLTANRRVPVSTAVVRHGSVRSFVEEEGRTRVPDRYVVSSPHAGRVFRIQKREGDGVEKGELLAEMDPLAIAGRIEEAEARARALARQLEGVRIKEPRPAEIERSLAMEERAKENREVAAREMEEARVALAQAERDAARERALMEKGAGTTEKLETAEMQLSRMQERINALSTLVRVRDYEIKTSSLETAVLKARVGDFQWEENSFREQIRAIEADLSVERDELKRARIEAPSGGVVLQRFQESEAVLAAGAPLLEIGSLDRLEVEADFLSEDASRMKVGLPAEIYGRALQGKTVRGSVRRVYPSAFRKISSLGVEQQRVIVVLDFPQEGISLGDRYRVDVRVLFAERENAMLVPEEALFRWKGDWHAFTVDGNHARLSRVETGLQDGRFRELLSGLKEGDQVILHPGEDLVDGAPIEPVPRTLP